MALSSVVSRWLNSVLVPYASPQRTHADVAAVLTALPTLSPRTETYAHNDGRTQLLLNLHGTLPITFRGAQYNIPVSFWLPHEYPRAPPLAYVTPTSDMLVRPGPGVDVSGQVEVDYVKDWSRKPEAFNLLTLTQILQDLFSKQPPLYAKPREPQRPSWPQHAATQPAPPRPPPRPHAAPSSRPTSIVGASPPPRPVSYAGEPPHPTATPPFSSPSSTHPAQHPYPHAAPAPPPRPVPASGTSSASPTPAPYTPSHVPPHRTGSLDYRSFPAPYAHAPVPGLPHPHPAAAAPPPAQYYASPPPQPLPSYHPNPAPAPAPVPPPPDLLSSPFPPPATTPGPAASLPARPPNPALLQLHAHLHSLLSSHLTSLTHSHAQTLQAQAALRSDLERGAPAMEDEMARLEAVRDVCATVARRVGEKVGEAEDALGDVRRRGEVGVDEVVCAETVVGNQLLDLIAEDRAIEDTIYHLGRALNTERIDLDRFLRMTRALAREQFMKRALAKKIQRGMEGEGPGAGFGGGAEVGWA